MENLLNYWWIPVLLVLVLAYRYVFQLMGIVIVPEDKIGLVTKKFVLFGDKRDLPPGHIIATEGEAGYQAQTLPPGLHFWKWIWQYQITLQPLVIIPSGQIGLLVAKDGSELPKGRVLAQSVPSDSFQDAEMFLKNGGQKGRQAAIIMAGTYRINTFLFEIVLAEMTQIEENKVGIITTLDGDPLDQGQIAGHDVPAHNNFQDADVFLKNGGRRGLQQQIVLAGMYIFNPWFVQIEQVDMILIPIGYVGVVNSFVGPDGKDVSGDDFKHGNIVARGNKGVWAEPLGPGKYPLNPYIMKVEQVPTTNLVLNWATARNESHNLDRHLSTITFGASRFGMWIICDTSKLNGKPSRERTVIVERWRSRL